MNIHIEVLFPALGGFSFFFSYVETEGDGVDTRAALPPYLA